MMKNLYKSQGHATLAFGVTFRSKLEAMWAYEFTSKKTEWVYTDSPWNDFILEGCIHVEIKPRGVDFFEQALERAWPNRKEWFTDPGFSDQPGMLFLLGEPDVSIWILTIIADCGQCAGLKIIKGIGAKEGQTYMWNPQNGVYGHFCKHGHWHDYGKGGCELAVST